MIVRILDEGQFELADGHLASLEELDRKMEAAIEANDTPAFEAALSGALAEVRANGKAVDADHVGPSDLAFPHEGATLDEVRALLDEEVAS